MSSDLCSTKEGAENGEMLRLTVSWEFQSYLRKRGGDGVANLAGGLERIWITMPQLRCDGKLASFEVGISGIGKRGGWLKCRDLHERLERVM